MARFRKREKIDFRKFINRFQRVRKFCRMHSLPVLVAVGIMVSVIFASYQNAYATGLEEYFYYTYFDLMSGLFAETGMDFALKDDYYTKSDRVSGKQVWDNFCTWVENKAKVAALPVEVVNKTVFDELKNLPNTVTAAGAKMSEKLSELLAKVLPGFDTTCKNQFDTSSKESVYNFIVGLLGASDFSYIDDLKDSSILSNVTNGYFLNIINDSGCFVVFACEYPFSINDDNFWGYYSEGGKKYYYSTDQAMLFPASKVCRSYSGNIIVNKGYSWVVRNGSVVSADGTTISDYANVKTLHDGSVYVPGEGFKDSWAVWDAIKDNVTTDEEEAAWNERYNLNNDDDDKKKKKKDDNKKDRLPVAIPIIFPNKKPDSTEKNSEKDSEKGTEDVVPGGKPKPGSSEKPDSTQKDSEKDSESDSEKATDPSDIPSIADRAGNWKRLFPFCIPWDMMELVKSMKSEKKAPVFEFEYTFKAVNYTWKIRIDMSDYWKYIKIFRWGMTIFFIIGLFFLTVKFTTFVYKMGS